MSYPPGRKDQDTIRSKQNGALQFAVRLGYSHCSHTEKVRVKIFKKNKKNYKILLVSKS